MKRFKRGTDIVVTTPKRLTDLLKIQAFTLDTVQHMVMDEADRLVSMGIGRELQTIWAALPEHKQVVLVSATDSRVLKKFSEAHQSAQKYVKADGEQPALDKIAHTMYRCSRQNKSRSLFRLLTMLDCEQALIFTRTRHDVDLLTQRLNEQGFASQGIHNEVPRRKRQERLSGFKNREFKFLVATDIASRGIDIDGLYYVINYDLPVNSNDYIHRVGRTARASSATQSPAASAPARQAPAQQWRSQGQSGPSAAQGGPASSPWAHAHTSNTAVPDIRGHAFSLVSPEQERLVGPIVKIVGKQITLEKNPFAR